MKKFIAIAFAITAFTGSVSAFADNGTPPPTKDLVIGINDVYVPSGFDSGANAFVVVNGIFPNSCYRYKDAEVVHTSTTVHEIRAHATVSQGMCLMVLVPFSKEVQLGQLITGTHSLRFINGDGTYMERQLVVE